MRTDDTQSLKSSDERQDTKKDYTKELHKLFYARPLSRRMVATELGFTDQTYMVTQYISDWIKQGKAKVIGNIKCSRSGHLVQAVTTNPDLFPKSNQLKLF